MIYKLDKIDRVLLQQNILDKGEKLNILMNKKNLNKKKNIEIMCRVLLILWHNINQN